MKNEPTPEITGDKGKDALIMAEAYVVERCKNLGWQQWYQEYQIASGQIPSDTPKIEGCH